MTLTPAPSLEAGLEKRMWGLIQEAYRLIEETGIGRLEQGMEWMDKVDRLWWELSDRDKEG